MNIRAVIKPDRLRKIFEDELARLPGTKTVSAMQCFSPAPPKPERRLTRS